jgi:hypothetical protein
MESELEPAGPELVSVDKEQGSTRTYIRLPLASCLV